jgi:hypothetical protein
MRVFEINAPPLFELYHPGKIPTTAGVRYVFSLPDGKEIKSVTEFKSGRAYLASSVTNCLVSSQFALIVV